MTASTTYAVDHPCRELKNAAPGRGYERTRNAARLKIPRIDVDTASREKLIAHIDELEFLLADMIPDDATADALGGALGLSRQQATILAALSFGRVVSKDRLCTVIGREQDIGTGWLNPINVRIHNLRKRIARFGIKINVVWGVGYQLDAASVGLVRSIIDGEG